MGKVNASEMSFTAVVMKNITLERDGLSVCLSVMTRIKTCQCEHVHVTQ